MAKVKPEVCLILQRNQLHSALRYEHADMDFAHKPLKRKGKGNSGALRAGSRYDPLYVLYTSGTTGQPKGVVRDNGGHMVALHWSMRNFFGVNPGETFWAASDIGWVVGHSYIVYGPLLAGTAT